MRPLDYFEDIHSHVLPHDEAGRERTVVSLDFNQALPKIEGGHGWFSVGLHPWSTDGMSRGDVDKAARMVEEAARHGNVVAVGECGIDRLRGGGEEIQEYAFRLMADISERLQKPLIIHCVRATDKILALHKELRPRQLWIIHGFRGKKQTSLQLTQHGIAISLGKKFNPAVTEGIDPSMIYRESDML